LLKNGDFGEESGDSAKVVKIPSNQLVDKTP
jgi:hypothetical protein